MLVAGVDPGKSGGYAVYDRDTEKLVRAGRLKFDDPEDLYLALDGVEECVIERAQGTSQMGASNSFEYGRAFGRTETAILMAGATLFYTAPQWWKGKLAISQVKSVAIQKALRIIPELKDYVKVQADDGVAEAALMGLLLLSEPLRQQLIDNNEKRAVPKRRRPTFRL